MAHPHPGGVGGGGGGPHPGGGVLGGGGGGGGPQALGTREGSGGEARGEIFKIILYLRGKLSTIPKIFHFGKSLISTFPPAIDQR